MDTNTFPDIDLDSMTEATIESIEKQVAMGFNSVSVGGKSVSMESALVRIQVLEKIAAWKAKKSAPTIESLYTTGWTF